MSPLGVIIYVAAVFEFLPLAVAGMAMIGLAIFFFKLDKRMSPLPSSGDPDLILAAMPLSIWGVACLVGALT